MHKGQCHCGAVRYEAQAEPIWSALCHCGDCRRHSGAPVVGWSAFPEASLKVVKGKAKIYDSSKDGRRHFCGKCGTGLFYFNTVNLPGIADVQTATLDDPNSVVPQIHVQTAERLTWMVRAHDLPTHERYPTKG